MSFSVPHGSPPLPPSHEAGADEAPPPFPPRVPFPLATALRRAWAKGYGLSDLRHDVLAGIVVGIVALPLSMALAIAVGAPPQHGLYTAIVGGGVVALLGGCKYQVTGPTAAFIVILAPIVSKHGLSGLLTAGFLAGLLLIAMGAARFGRFIQYIPYPVTTGFTTGIAAVIATLQIKDALGLHMGPMPEHYTDKLAALWSARGSFAWEDLTVAVATFALLRLLPRVTTRVPAPLVAIAAVSAAVAAVHAAAPDFSVATIGTRFHTQVGGVDVAGIPSVLPSPALPWAGSGFSMGLLRELFPAAFAIAMLGAIESLLSAVIADGMTGTKHDPNAELIALGIGNTLAPFFGGIAATGALARTATNIKAGARSPIAAFTHAVVVLLAVLALAPLVAYVPMASLAALLLVVAWNMSEAHHFAEVIRVAPRSDAFVLLTCFGLTVFFDMVIAVGVGIVLAALLFMGRMAQMTEARLQLDSVSDERGERELPKGVSVYAIQGPLFFGAAQNAIDALHAIRGDSFQVLILDLGRVPVIDATGLSALESAITKLVRLKKRVIIAGPLPRPREIFVRARLALKYGVEMAESLDDAVALGRALIAAPRSPSGRPKAAPATGPTRA